MKHRGGRRRLIGALVLAVVVTACGSSGGSKSSGESQSSADAAGSSPAKPSGAKKGKLDVCAVITPADAATVFAESATPQASASPEPLVSGLCIYSHPGDDLKVRNLLQVRVYPGEQFYGENLFPTATKLTGVGEKGFVNVDAQRHKIDLQFVKDGKTGVIAYTTGAGVDIATREEAIKTVGKKLAGAM